MDYLVLQSHVSDWLQGVLVATYTKDDIVFYQLPQENFKNDMVVAVVLASQFNTGKSPIPLFHFKPLLAEPE